MERKRTILFVGALCVLFCNLHGDLKEIRTESRTSSFNEMFVRHATRMCNRGFYETYSQNGNDFVDFWVEANEVNLDLEKAYTCMRLFYNNSKSCDIVDYSVVDHITKVMPQLFERYFEKKDDKGGEFKIIREDVEDLMLDRFTDQLNRFQSEPDIFLSKLSSDVTSLVRSRFTIIQQEAEEQELKRDLRSMIIRFLDHSINKLYWYKEDFPRIWSSVTSIASNLHTIGKRGIIDSQDRLDELWDSLVRRFEWYLKSEGSYLPVEFYDQIEDDLKGRTIFFLEAEEQDPGIRSKKEMIVNAVVKAKAKAIAYERSGLITDQTVTG